MSDVLSRDLQMLSHDLRVRVLDHLAERSMASPVEMAAEFGEPLGNVSYHVRFLADGGLIREVKTTPRRGAVEHHYAIRPRARRLLEAFGALR